MAPEVFKCAKCGNVYEKTYAPCGCTPVCCGEPAVPLTANTANPDENKHVPFIVPQGDSVLVKVGKNEAHPMTEEHYIVWIGIVTADGIEMRKYLKPGDKPEAVFPVGAEGITAYELCNKHNLWKSQ